MAPAPSPLHAMAVMPRCEPSQRPAGFFECPHVHAYTVFVSGVSFLIGNGLKDEPLWLPSQKGKFFDLPQLHSHFSSPAFSVSAIGGPRFALLGARFTSEVLHGQSECLSAAHVRRAWRRTKSA